MTIKKTTTANIGIAAIMFAFLFTSCSESDCTMTDSQRKALTEAHFAATGPAEADPMNIDFNAFVEKHYAPDAIFMPPNAPEVRGREAITTFLMGFPTLTKFHTVDVEINGSSNLAFVRGTYELRLMIDDSTEVTDIGKYIEIWQTMDDGSWLCTRDIFNSDLPL